MSLADEAREKISLGLLDKVSPEQRDRISQGKHNISYFKHKSDSRKGPFSCCYFSPNHVAGNLVAFVPLLTYRVAAAPGTPVQKTYRLTHVDRAIPSRRHSLSGLWKGGYGGETPVQVVQITYDFSGPSAKVRAMKVSCLWTLLHVSISRSVAQLAYFRFL
jgi:hypothetical protein